MDHGYNSKWSLQASQTAVHIHSWGEADLWEPCIAASVPRWLCIRQEAPDADGIVSSPWHGLV